MGKSHLRFVIAQNPGHFQAAHKLMRDEKQEKCALQFPTILAYEDDELVAFVSTRIMNKMIVAGPLVAKSDHRRLWTIMRLCEAYESAMAEMGITSFILYVETGSILERGMKRYFPELRPYAMDGKGNAFYTWRLSRGRQQGISPTSEPGGEGTSTQPS